MKNNVCLCVGTFFTLIIEGLPKSGQKRRGKYANYAVMEKLLKVLSPEFTWGNDTNKSSITSKLKNCETYGDTTPLADKICLADFDTLVKDDYPAALERMTAFAKSYVSEDKKNWLVSALIELTNMDDPAGSNGFLAGENGESISVKELSAKIHYVEPLLLGIWHHIVINCRDNTVGADILNAWYSEKDSKYETAEFMSNIGQNQKFRVDVEFLNTVPQTDEASDMHRQEANCADNATEETSAGGGITNNYFGKASIQLANVINNIGHVDHLD